MATNPLVLYSTNATLAYQIAEKYYGWCTPCFSSKSGCEVPPSSEPMVIATRLWQDIIGRDKHSTKIEGLRIGIKLGATRKEATGVITPQQLLEINLMVDDAQFTDFKPLLFVIPFERVQSWLQPAPFTDKASYRSVEYIIESLPNDCFDVIKIFPQPGA
jgi:hypothetical protein